jgi:hypothetical protein
VGNHIDSKGKDEAEEHMELCMYRMKSMAETESETGFDGVVHVTNLSKPFVFKEDSNIMSVIRTLVP